MAIIWKEFPEINRNIGFSVNYNTTGSSIGCHCGQISSVKLTWGQGYYSGGDGKNIKLIDSSKEPAIVWKRDKYNDYYVAPDEEVLLVEKFLREIKKLDTPDFLKLVYDEVVDRCKDIPLWVLSDAINYGSDAKNPIKIESGYPLDRYVYVNIGGTGKFAKYLIDNKIGYVLQSPIIQNPLHRSMGNYSLNQGWFWIPPKHLARAIDTAEAFGDDQFVSKEAWEATVAKDLKLKDPLEACKRAFNEGVFPEEKRFRRKKMSAKVVEELQEAIDEDKEPEIVLDKNYNTVSRHKVKEA